MTSEEMKQWINGASYRELLQKWRFASAGDPFFVGEIGDYYTKKMAEKHDKVGDTEHTRISKSIGW